MDAAGLASPEIPHLFARNLHEIPPALNEDLLDLYGRSEQALANQFAFFNRLETLEADFDWESCGTLNWRRELHAFGYALDLAMTYRISQEDRYALHLRYLIAHWIAGNPPGQTTGWEPEPLARRIRNWILAADLARQKWESDADFLALFERSLAMQSVFLSRRTASGTSPEAASHVARAMLLASRYFAGPRGAALGESGRVVLRGAVQAALAEDGNSNCLRPAELLAVAAASVENLALQAPAEASQRESDMQEARCVLGLLEGALAPDGTLPMFGPSARSGADEVPDLFALAAVIFEEPRWKNLAGKLGIFPYLLLGESGRHAFEQISEQPWAAGTRATPEIGLCRLSAGRRSALVINARHISSSDDHHDFLSYELHLAGHRVVVDSGAHSPPGESGDGYFASDRAHNVLLVDGRAARRERPRSSPAAGVGWIIGEGCRGVSFEEESWDFGSFRHRRAFYALGESAFAVLDLLEGAGAPDRVTNLIHFYPTFEIEMGSGRAIIRSRALRLAVIPLASTPASGVLYLSMKAARGTHPDFPGFFSPDIGVKFGAPVLALEVSAAQLPWLSGYLIVADADAAFRSGNVSPHEGSIEFELAGKRHKLVAR